MRVIVPDTGGGFGQKMHVMPEDLAVAALARVAGRPVKWIETRRENLAAASQAREARVEIEAAADDDGVLLGLRARVVSDAGAYHIHPLTAALEPLGTAAILPGPYRTPAYAYECMAVATNKPPLGAYRGVGMAMGAFVMERTLDLLADRLRLDPAEIRRRNLIPRDAYPFTSAGGLRLRQRGSIPKALEQALDLAGYDRLTRERDEARGRGRLLGVGLACYTEYTGMGSETYRRRGMVDVPGVEAARVELLPDARRRLLRLLPVPGAGARAPRSPSSSPTELGDRAGARRCPPRRHREPRPPGPAPSRAGAPSLRAAPSGARPPPCARSSSSWRPDCSRPTRPISSSATAACPSAACPTAA